MLKIADIKLELDNCIITDYDTFIKKYSNDDRAGVIKIVNTAIKKKNAYEYELIRLKEITEYENKYYNLGYELIGGIDEVGRGPYAGPVVTACVILPKDCNIMGINDSKKLSLKKREQLFDIIQSKAIAIGIGMADCYEIDELNINNATFKAMRTAIDNMKVKPEQLLVDAVKIPDINIPQESIIKGDAKSISIGAASIIAKVIRDRLMIKYSDVYPEYGFDKNVGYGTREHEDAIKKFGLCDIHRRSFTRKFQ